MKTKIITEIEQSMLKHLDNAQLKELHRVLEHVFSGVTISKSTEDTEKASNEDVLNDFIAAKKIEGCSDKSLKYYRKTITVALNSVGKEIKHIILDAFFRVSSHGSKMRIISLKVPFGVYTR